MGIKTNALVLNFVAGEISPQVSARHDLDLLQKACSRVENFIVLPQGGAAYRPGSYNLGLTKNLGTAALIPFQFSARDAIMMVATDSCLRFYRNDAVVLNTALTIQSADKANPARLYVPTHTYANGDEVYVTGVGGMTQLNGRFFIVQNQLQNKKTITGITKANPGVFTTSGAHGLSVGQRVNISGAAGGGFTAVNGNWLVNTTPTGTTFTVKDITTGTPLNTTAYSGAYTGSSGSVDASYIELKDQWGANIDSSAYSTFTSGGTVASIFELTTPYQAQDLAYIRTAQTADVMYLACRNEDLGSSYNPYKLVRQSLTSWTLSTYKRTADPFPSVGLLSLTATAISKSNPCKVTVASTGTLANGDVVYVEKINGMTELSGNFYYVANKTTNSFTLRNPDGTNVDATSFTTYTNGGIFTRHARDPGCVAFSADGRAVFASTQQNPEGLWASRTPKAFLTRYDDFTIATTAVATDPTLGMAFSFSPVANQIDTIREMVQFGGNFALLGANSIRQIYGAQKGQPATPVAINTLPTLQGAARAKPLVINWNMLFIDVNQQRLRGLQYNLAYDTYQANDYNLTSEHLGLESQFIRLAHIKGSPDIVFCLRADGVLLAFTFNNIENISGWSRLIAGGSGAKVLDINTIRKADGTDELWMIVERTMGGKTYRTVEVMDVWPVIPTRQSFYGDATTKTADESNWQSAVWESLKESTFLDASLTYDGTARGIAADADLTITGSLTVGATVTVTASQSVFLSTDVGSQIWKMYDSTGAGGGKLQITAYTSGTQVTAQVVAAPDTSAATAGNWAFAVNSLSNLYIYEGLTVNLQVDGGGHPSRTVSGGVVTLKDRLYASKVQIGFGYNARMATTNLQFVQGFASKPRTIKRVRARFYNTIGCSIGPSEYQCPAVNFNRASQIADRVPTPYTGVVDLPVLDNWDMSSKNLWVLHSDPTPCTILSLDVEGIASDPP